MKNIIFVIGLALLTSGCELTSEQPISDSSKKLTVVKVDPDLDRATNEDGGIKRVSAPYRETVHVNGKYRKNLAKGTYSFQMEAGFLKDQVEALLLNHQRIRNADSIVWNASPNFQWPSQFVAYGDSYESVLDQVLSGYNLEAVFMKNDVVVVQPLK